mgnify:CR=1 FL=1
MARPSGQAGGIGFWQGLKWVLLLPFKLLFTKKALIFLIILLVLISGYKAIEAKDWTIFPLELGKTTALADKQIKLQFDDFIAEKAAGTADFKDTLLLFYRIWGWWFWIVLWITIIHWAVIKATNRATEGIGSYLITFVYFMLFQLVYGLIVNLYLAFSGQIHSFSEIYLPLSAFWYIFVVHANLWIIPMFKGSIGFFEKIINFFTGFNPSSPANVSPGR